MAVPWPLCWLYCTYKYYMKESFSSNSVFDYTTSKDKLMPFVYMLRSHGCYISEDGHIRNKKGTLISKLTRDGYWLTIAQYDDKYYYFYEQDVIWAWHNGPIPEDKIVKHKNNDRSNNQIENLKLDEATSHTSSCESGEIEPQPDGIIKLGVLCGWNDKQVSGLIGYKIDGMGVHNEQYPTITPSEIMGIYPSIVDFTRNKDISLTEELKNYALGLAGETGEVCDLIKKLLYHRKDVSPVELVLELGDVLYYLCAICHVLGVDLDEICLNNNAKLIARYPNGFNHKDSENRIEDKNVKC